MVTISLIYDFKHVHCIEIISPIFRMPLRTPLLINTYIRFFQYSVALNTKNKSTDQKSRTAYKRINSFGPRVLESPMCLDPKAVPQKFSFKHVQFMPNMASECPIRNLGT